MRAVVASAGQGSRMLPLTKDLPKPMVPVLDKPFLYYLLTQLDLAGFTDLVVVTGFRSATVEKFVRTL
ncbi:MAG: sugar phosphate nucleotidyltransferase, partial [Patescibacteria group bacterium]